MRHNWGSFVVYFTILFTASGCANIRRGITDNNVYFSTQSPNIQIKVRDDFEYSKGPSGQYQHQFLDKEGHRFVYIHYTLHEPNETQVDYFHAPEHWIYATIPDSVEIERFKIDVVGEKWYVRDTVRHASTASCFIMRDLGVFTDRHDVLKMLYAWQMPPYVCKDWKLTDSLSDSQKQFLQEFREGYVEDVQITEYQDGANTGVANGVIAHSINRTASISTSSPSKQPTKKVFPSQPVVQNEQKTQELIVAKPQLMNVAIFPWTLEGDAGSLAGIIKEKIKYYIEESDNLQLVKSYYKIKKIPKLNVSSASSFYRRNQPNTDLVKQIAAKENIQLAILGTLDVKCKWSDNCPVKRMEITLIDLTTGNITSQKAPSSNLGFRELMDSNLLKAFRKSGINIRE